MRLRSRKMLSIRASKPLCIENFGMAGTVVEKIMGKNILDSFLCTHTQHSA